MTKPVDRDQLTEALDWWVELVADLEPDTKTFTVTMSRAMAERTLAVIDQLLAFPTDKQVEVAAQAIYDAHQAGAGGHDAARVVLEAVTMIGDNQ